MGRRRISKPMFVIGDFVFAKVHGYRAWPARILGRYGTVSNIKYSVFFYGTSNTAKVSSSQIFEFGKNKRSLGALPSRKNARNADFRKAMAHVHQAFAKPEGDFRYYQVLARTKGEGDNAVAYEVVLPPTESEEETDPEDDDSEESSSPKAEDYSMKSLKCRYPDSEEKLEESQPAKKPMKSMPLLDDLDAPDQAEAMTTPEKKQPEKPEGLSPILFSDTDSDDFELPLNDNPIVRSQSFRDYEQQHNTGIMSTMPRSLRLDSDDASEIEVFVDGGYENDQPINLSCRHITADEQWVE